MSVEQRSFLPNANIVQHSTILHTNVVECSIFRFFGNWSLVRRRKKSRKEVVCFVRMCDTSQPSQAGSGRATGIRVARVRLQKNNNLGNMKHMVSHITDIELLFYVSSLINSVIAVGQALVRCNLIDIAIFFLLLIGY